MSDPGPVRTLLDWHAARRSTGTPTVTALAGPTHPSVRAWRAWAGPRPVCVVRESDPDAVAAAWVNALPSPRDHVHNWLAALTNRPVADIIRDTDRATRYDLDRLRQSLPLDPTGPSPRVAFAILAGVTDLVRELSAGVAVRGLCEIVPTDGWPALLVVTPEPARVAAFLASLAKAVPALPLALSAPRPECEAVADPVVREGVIVVPSVSEGELTDRLRAAGVVPPPAPATLRKLVADGLDDASADSFVAAAVTVRRPSADDLASDFRSFHEGFLFEQLEAMPETAGLFRPNVALPFRHGNKPAEADLLAAGPKIVVEVDGGHYHLEATQYRRDRRKDWLYQQHGYLVLRFLAEDLMDDFEAILTTILSAVALRRGGPTSEGCSP